MTDIMLSIHPRHADAILDGCKTVEVRTTLPLKIWRDEKIYLYATSPIQKVIGVVEYDSYMLYRPECEGADYFDKGYTDRVAGLACISREELIAYLGTREYVYLWHIKAPHRFPIPESLEKYGLARPPQSYQYLGGGIE